MEKSLCVNVMLYDVITKINNSLIPASFEGDGRSIRDYNVSYRLMENSMKGVVDEIGALSAAAQGLNKVITTADKLRTADNHILYLYKDANALNGAGAVVGMLKVGRKHLFLADAAGRVLEVEPLCVLDFFVLPTYQRAGVGKALFDHMLQDQGTEPHQIAIDGPSKHMAAFLRHKYGIEQLLRQNNNFAVAPNFFDNLTQDTSKRDHSSPPPVSEGPVGRHTAPRPHDSIANLIHGGTSSGDDADLSPKNNFMKMDETTATDWRAATSCPSPAPPRSWY